MPGSRSPDSRSAGALDSWLLRAISSVMPRSLHMLLAITTGIVLGRTRGLGGDQIDLRARLEEVKARLAAALEGPAPAGDDAADPKAAEANR